MPILCLYESFDLMLLLNEILRWHLFCLSTLMVALNVQVISVQFFRSYSLKLMLRTYLISMSVRINMKKIKQRTVHGCVGMFFVFFSASLIATVHAEDNANENEVVIHSNHVNMKSPGASLGVKSPDTLLGAAPYTLAEGKNIASSNNKDKDDFYEDVTTYEELLEYLKKEKDYLGKLDQKFEGLRQNVSAKTELVDMAQSKAADAGVEKSKLGVIKLSPVKEKLVTNDSSKEKESQAEGKSEEVKVAVESKENNDRYINPFDKAEVLYEGGKYHDAWRAYKMVKVGAINERDYIWAQFQICNCYRAVKKFDEAAKMYQEFINKYPDSFWAEQAAWYIQDSMWWKEWNDKVESRVVSASTGKQ